MRRTHLAFALALAGALPCLPSTALASGNSPLQGLGGEVSEVSHRTDIAVRGFVAEVKTTQAVAAKKRTAEAIYTFKLPSDGAITELKVSLPGGKTTTARLVDASSVLEPAPETKGARPDVALLRLVRVDGWESTYELRVFPVRAGRTVTWSYTWIAPMSYMDGRMVLRVPPRGAHGNLVSEQVFVSGRAAGGFDGFERIVGSGRALGNKLPARFSASARRGMTLELVPRVTSKKPRMEMASVRLPGKRAALAYSLVTPHHTLSPRDRPTQVLVVVDTSLSMGHAGHKAAARLTSALLDDAPAGARIGIIAFDREARVLGKGLVHNSPASRKSLVAELGRQRQRNGSDLAATVQLIDDTLKGGKGPARVVVISDALTPLAQTPAATASLASTRLLGRARIAHVTLIPGGAPLPQPENIAAGGLVHESRGRMTAVRHLEVKGRKDELWDELWAPPPLRDLELDRQDELLADQPTKLASGSGVFAVGFYRGKAPRKLGATGVLGGQEIDIRATRRRGLDKAIMPLLLAPIQVLPDGFDDLSLRELAEKHGVVTRSTALWAPFPGDKFARARLAMARKFGTQQFRRLPPAVEQGETYRSYRFVAPRPDPSSPPLAQVKQPTGSLDRDIVKRLMRTYVVPRVHGCYRRALVPAKSLRGQLTVVVELTRGEVQAARIDGALTGNSDWAAKVEECALKAAYQIRVPKVQQGSTFEAVSVVRYPLNFKIVDERGRVIEGKRTEKDVDTGSPLDGLDIED